MPAPTITALPVAPQRADEPATFVTKADDFVAALDPLVSEINAFGTYFNGLGLTGVSGSITATALTMTTARLLGRTTASTGPIEEISIGSGLTMAAGVLSASGATFASAAEVRTGTVSTKAVAPDTLQTAAAPQTLTDGATINWDMSTALNAKVTLGGNRTFAAPTNPKEGLTYALEVAQDGTGSRTATWNAAFDWGAAGTPTLSTGASKKDFVFLYCYDPTTPKFRASFSKAA